MASEHAIANKAIAKTVAEVTRTAISLLQQLWQRGHKAQQDAN